MLPHSPASAPKVKGQTVFDLTRLVMIAYVQGADAMKYGAPSTEAGAVRLTGRRNGETYESVWAEAGGPAVSEPPIRRGFDTVSAERRLDGTLAHDWNAAGPVMGLAVPAANLTA